MASDPVVARAALPPAVDERCVDAQVLDVIAPRGTPGAGARVYAPADCPLTFAMNYAENLRGIAFFGSERRQPATVFPTYGALAGRTPSGPVTFARVSTDDRAGRIAAYVGEGRFTDDPLKTFGTRAVVEVPGVVDGDIHFHVNGQTLTIEARRRDGRRVIRLRLPAAVSTEGATSSYRNGMFEIVLPKATHGSR